jgi:hypothetical protein
MYRRTLFLEALHQIREEMSREADYDVDLFAEMVRTGQISKAAKKKKAAPEAPSTGKKKTLSKT